MLRRRPSGDPQKRSEALNLRTSLTLVARMRARPVRIATILVILGIGHRRNRLDPIVDP